MGIEDRQLIEQILAGATEDFRELVERHQRAIYRFAFGLIGSHEEAQDITQETFLAAYANLSSHNASRASFSTWLFTIARNRCINWLKRKRPDKLEELDSIPGDPAQDPIANEELAQQLDRALSELPMEQRSAFLLAEIEDLPYAEIARIENTSLGTIKSRIHRARHRLQTLLLPVFGKHK